MPSDNQSPVPTSTPIPQLTTHLEHPQLVTNVTGEMALEWLEWYLKTYKLTHSAGERDRAFGLILIEALMLQLGVRDAI